MAANGHCVNSERRSWRRMISPLPSVMLTPVERWLRRLWLWFFAVVLAAAAVFWPCALFGILIRGSGERIAPRHFVDGHP
jgi:hypothetical protein